MKYFSTFSGIGGFELGIQRAYETFRHTHVQAFRERQTTAKRISPEKRKGLHAISGKRALPIIHRDYEDADGGFNPRQPHCIGFSEIDKYAIQVYQKHFPEHKNYGDITKIDAKTLPSFDLLVGGL